MKAALIQDDYSLKVEEVPTPKPGPGEVLVNISHCGICGSDLHYLKNCMMLPGAIIGHEISGHIAELGEGVTDWQEGDPVIVFPLNSCLTCESCMRGDVQLCTDVAMKGYGQGFSPGGYAQYMVVRSEMLVKLPDGLDIKTAALTEPWSVAVHGVLLSQFIKGKEALVMGAGPIGLLSVYALKHAGANKIFVTEPDPFRAKRAKNSGASAVFNPLTDSIVTEIMKTSGRNPDYVFECVGTEDSMQEASFFVGSHGHVIMLGLHHGNVKIMPLVWFTKELKISFSIGYRMDEFKENAELLAEGVLDPENVISDTIALNEINDAVEMLKGPGHMKILIDCE